jgi:hypothetical protein
MIHQIIQYTKQYFFCNICDKCYIYKGSYDKHKKVCITLYNDDDIIDNNIDDDIIDNNIDDNTDIIIYKKNNELNQCYKIDQNTIDIIYPVYLFIIALFFGFIKEVCIGF